MNAPPTPQSTKTSSARTCWGELTVSRVGIDGLEETEGDPDVDGDDVQVWLEPAVEQRSDDRSRSENHDFERVGVFCGEAEGRGVFVVELVDVLVEQGRVEELMGCGDHITSHRGEGVHQNTGQGRGQKRARTEVVEHVLENKEECELREHGLPRRERHLPSAHAKGLSDRVEEEDLRG